VAADKIGKDAINAYREQMRTKGANKEKPKKPKVIVRVHPARTSNAQFIQDMVNAVEVVDGEEMQLRCFVMNSISAARSRAFRLMKDGLAEKSGEYVENGTTKAKYKKTGRVAL
jgi:hypothetical protein